MALLSGSITVKEETVDDAAAAVDALAGHERIDKQRIFVLGHSLGGMLLPRIAKANDKIAGFISLAGSTRPMEDLILEQTKYLVSLGGNLTDDQQKQIEQLEQQIAKVKSPDLSPQTAAKELPLGVPAKYWLDLRGFDPAEAAKEIEKPNADLARRAGLPGDDGGFGRWKKALGSRTQVKFISYPNPESLVHGRQRKKCAG